MLPKKAAPVYIAVSDKEKLRTWADSYTRAVRQRTVRQETTMAKTGTLLHYLYSNKIIEVPETTEALRLSDLEKEVSNMTDQNELPEEESRDEEQEDQLDSASEEEDDLLSTSVSNITSLDEGSFFLVGCSSRLGRSIKINARFLS